MLSIGKLAPGQQTYYLDTVAAGLEEYYTGAKEAPGQWLGRSAARLVLDGVVDGSDLAAILDGLQPNTGERLTRAQGAPKVPGFDATFNAPKSVSLLFALGDPEVSNEVRNAHDAAVTAAVGVLEDEAARARRGKGGLTQIPAEGFVAAAFRHRTSRAGDPHLHTHVLVANLVYALDDERWSALDARPLYGWAKTAGYLYEAHLRHELSHRLGVTWQEVTNGIADLRGIPDKAIREFSRRRQQIEAHLAAHGETGARAAQIATYATRTAKDPDLDPAGLLPEWRARAAAVGLDGQTLAVACDRTRSDPPARLEPAEAAPFLDRLAATDGLTRLDATFGRREVIQAIAAALPAGAPVQEVLDRAHAFLDSPNAIAVRGEANVIHRSDGTVAPAPVDNARWTTPEMLATEQRLIDSAITRFAEGSGVVVDETLGRALAVQPTLADEQVDMVRRLCTAGHGVDVVVGHAGTGKTFALAAARQAWVAGGYRVVGAALAARAATELEIGAGIPSTTLDRLLHELERGDTLDEATVVVVDEAAMVGTRKLARLLDYAQDRGAKVVLVGDHRQLSEIDAGGAFASLARRLGAAALTDNRRQSEPWERVALAELRHGQTDVALTAYENHGRLHTAGSGFELRDQLVDDWLAAEHAGQNTLMLASRRRDVADLNRRARAKLASVGGLRGDRLVIGDQSFVVGDRVLALRNDYDLGLINGTLATITSIDEDHRTLIVERDDGSVVTVPAKYIEAGHLTHGYAMTIHKAQGTTVDRTFVLADQLLDRERAYSALSRGRQRNDLYLADADDHRDDDRHLPEITPGEAAEFGRRLQTINLKTMAIDLRTADLGLEPVVLRSEHDVSISR